MKTITFYSYKGGVGRSLALANIATRLVEFNKKVCLLDFDLEAPGLPYKFQNRITFSQGIVDYIHEYYVNGHLPDNIKDYSRSFQILQNRPHVNFIGAGDTESTEYWKKLSAINWYNLLYETDHGIAFFLDLKEKIRKEFKPDFLLIDSRTGITETAGISLSLFADEVVVLAANNRENLEGSQKIIKSLSDKEKSILGKEIKITFVLSRIPYYEKADEKIKEINIIRNAMQHIDRMVVGEPVVIHSDNELQEKERLKIGYDKDDVSSSQVSRDYLNLFERITKNDLTEEEKERFQNKKKAEKLFGKSVSEEDTDAQMGFINEAIKLDPDNSDFYIHRIDLNLSRKNYDPAIEDCKRILMSNPESFKALFWLGIIYYSMGKYEEAIAQYKIVLRSFTDPAVYDNIGLAYEGLNDYETAILFYTKAIELYPFSARVYNSRANSYRLVGKIDEALSDVYKSIEMDSGYAMAYTTLAEINAVNNKENEFYINLEIALRIASDEKSIDIPHIERAIRTDKLYKVFYDRDRFQKILEKYNIILLDDETLPKIN